MCLCGGAATKLPVGCWQLHVYRMGAHQLCKAPAALSDCKLSDRGRTACLCLQGGAMSAIHLAAGLL